MLKNCKLFKSWCLYKALRYVPFVTLILCIEHTSLAQSRLSLYHFDSSVPQANMLNPAIVPNYKVVVGLPAISGIHFGFSNSGIAWRDMFIYDKFHDFSFDRLKADSVRLLNKIKDGINTKIDAEIQLFYFGLRIKKHYFSLGLHTSVNAYVASPGKLASWIAFQSFNDLPSPEATSLNLNNIYVRGLAYNQASVGYAYNISDKIRVGLRAKYLMGIGAASLSPLKGLTYLGADSLYIKSGNAHVNSSGQDIIEDISRNGLTVNTILDNLFNTNNWGLAFDIGAYYQINDRLSVSASVTNLGFITWRKNLRTYEIKEGEYSTRKFFLGETTISQEVNKAEENFQFNEYVGGEFTTNLNPNIYLNANYRVYKKHTVRALAYIDINDKNVNPAFGIAYNAPVGKFMSATVGLSYKDKDFLNVGIGLALRLGPVQVYGSTDRFNCVFEPDYLPQGNIQGGINLVFNKRKKKKKKEEEEEEDMVTEEEPVQQDTIAIEEPVQDTIAIEEPVQQDIIRKPVPPPVIQEPIVEKAPIVQPVQAFYYVVVGAFENLDYAQQYSRNLKSVGYDSDIEQLTYKNLNYVYVFKTRNDKEAAREKLYELWREDNSLFSKAWVLTVPDE